MFKSLLVFNFAYVAFATQIGISSVILRTNSLLDTKLSSTPLLSITTDSVTHCGSKCWDNDGCTSFNYGPNGECELLGEYLCDGSSTLQTGNGFRYFDFDVNIRNERMDAMLQTPICLQHGHCSPKCGTGHGGMCAYDGECQVTDLMFQCMAVTCDCRTGHIYNTTTEQCQEDLYAMTTVSPTTVDDSTVEESSNQQYSETTIETSPESSIRENDTMVDTTPILDLTNTQLEDHTSATIQQNDVTSPQTTENTFNTTVV